MSRKKPQKLLTVEALRHSEYYGMQETFDDLYARSQNGDIFTDLMKLILSRENILLAYRNIKANSGSYTPGTDKLTIQDLGKLTPEELVDRVYLIISGKWGYRPRPVRRKDIPKPNGSTRPLGIPCIWDRLIQQCVKQVMEPICEAKFSDNSYGFRPLRKAEHAIAATYKHMQRSNLHFCIEFDIKSFFDEVDHSKLMKQIWALGIHDKHLLYVIKQILKAPIRMPNGETVNPAKGTPQGGIISPLLANIVLNELDHWVESQWQSNPITAKFNYFNYNGSKNNRYSYELMKRTKLKEMYIVRYADDFRVFCRTKSDANNTLIAITQWLKKRLRLQVSPEKTKVVNVKRRYSEFLGFKIKLHKKSNKYVVKSHIADKSLKRITTALVEQAKNVAKPRTPKTEAIEIALYNSQVEGIQNYYRIATDVNIDCGKLGWRVKTVFANRLSYEKRRYLVKKGRALTAHERQRYGATAMIRYVVHSKEPIYPIGYVQHRSPMFKKRSMNAYTPAGRKDVHDTLRIDTSLMHKLMSQPFSNRSTEYADNTLSLFSAQHGKCAVTRQTFTTPDNIHCHHKIPKRNGGTDKYQNLILVLPPVHNLIHATTATEIKSYLAILNLTKEQLAKVNRLRERAGYAKL